MPDLSPEQRAAKVVDQIMAMRANVALMDPQVVGKSLYDMIGLAIAEAVAAERAELDSVRRERDLLAELLQKLSLDTYDIMLPNEKHIVYDDLNDNWFVSGEDGEHKTQLDAIRAALKP